LRGVELKIGSCDKDGNLMIDVIGDLEIWQTPEGKYGIWRKDRRYTLSNGPARGYKWIQLVPFNIETEGEMRELIASGMQDYCVSCQICGKQFQRVSNHLKVHGITKKAYIEQFPKAELYSNWYKAKHSESKLEDWADPEHRYNSQEFRDMKREQLIKMRKPTAPELELLKTLNWLYPKEFEYVGDGGLWFNGEVNANPDILNEKRKIVVEMNGCYWHGCDICGYEDLFGAKVRDAKKRETYEKNGYLPITFWEHEMFDTKYIVDVITYFCEERNPDIIQFYDSIKV